MTDKNKLKGKWVSYYDKVGARKEPNGQREGKVIKIVGKTLTVQNAVGERKRIHPDKYKILGVYFRKKLEEIEWK